MVTVTLPKKTGGKITSAVGLHKALIYITNPIKTQDFKLVSGQNLEMPEDAYDEMITTRELSIQIGYLPPKNERYAWHIVQAFSPDDRLTPEQINEIGRKTMQEYLGNDYEFVCATHVDKDHIHNHIIFNAVNLKTLRRFHQDKEGFALLKEISDRISDSYGAYIIPEKLNNSRTQYQAYLEKNSYRREIKKRVDFLRRHSQSLEDFLAKAAELDLEVDWSDGRKYVTYVLNNSDQKQKIRDRSLGTKKEKAEGKYLKEKMLERFAQNGTVFNVNEIEKEFNRWNRHNEKEVEIKTEIEPWQIERITDNYLYLNLNFGIRQKGTIRIPLSKVDKLENGNYVLYLKRFDKFYFLSHDDKESSRLIYGATVIRQLSYDSGRVPIYSNNALKRIHQLAEELNFLARKGLSVDYNFAQLRKDLIQTFEETQDAIQALDNKMIELNQAAKVENDPELLKQIEALQVERKELQGTFDKAISDMDMVERIYHSVYPTDKERKEAEDGPKL